MQPPASFGSGSSSVPTEPTPTYRPPEVQVYPEARWLRTVGVIIGLTVFVGFLAFQATFMIQPPCTTGSCPVLTPDQAAYDTGVRILAWVGLAALDLSVALSVMVAFFLNAGTGVPEATRRSSFYFAALFLASFTIFSTLMTSYLYGFLRFI